jgi:hypothetical protein
MAEAHRWRLWRQYEKAVAGYDANCGNSKDENTRWGKSYIARVNLIILVNKLNE